jgi:hypothetical protein
MKLILQPTNLKTVDGLETAYIGESDQEELVSLLSEELTKLGYEGD